MNKMICKFKTSFCESSCEHINEHDKLECCEHEEFCTTIENNVYCVEVLK